MFGEGPTWATCAKVLLFSSIISFPEKRGSHALQAAVWPSVTETNVLGPREGSDRGAKKGLHLGNRITKTLERAISWIS